jgi:hypothetical protein
MPPASIGALAPPTVASTFAAVALAAPLFARGPIAPSSIITGSRFCFLTVRTFRWRTAALSLPFQNRIAKLRGGCRLRPLLRGGRRRSLFGGGLDAKFGR